MEKKKPGTKSKPDLMSSVLKQDQNTQKVEEYACFNRTVQNVQIFMVYPLIRWYKTRNFSGCTPFSSIRWIHKQMRGMFDLDSTWLELICRSWACPENLIGTHFV